MARPRHTDRVGGGRDAWRDGRRSAGSTATAAGTAVLDLWVAALASNIGTWMQNVGAAWFMAVLADSPLVVSLVQSATYLPVVLVGLFAGALADVVDRRASC